MGNNYVSTDPSQNDYASVAAQTNNNYVSTDPSQNSYAAETVSNNNYASLDPSLNAFATDAAGFPNDDSSGVAPSNIDLNDPDSSPVGSGMLSTLESWGSTAVNSVESGVKTVYGGAKTVVGDVVGGAENAVTGVASSFTGDILLVLGLVVVGLVLIAQSGAIKATVSR